MEAESWLVSFQCDWALWVLMWVGLVFRELLYCLGRWVGWGSAGASPQWFGFTSDDTIYALVLFPVASDSLEMWVSEKLWGLFARMCPCGLDFLRAQITSTGPVVQRWCMLHECVTVMSRYNHWHCYMHLHWWYGRSVCWTKLSRYYVTSPSGLSALVMRYHVFFLSYCGMCKPVE
jgi:hypothetical protein